jgi:RES domain-containing protein
MTGYRISNQQYSQDLSGEGARLFGARWNSVGIPMLYLSSHASLAILELLVHVQWKQMELTLDLLSIRLPDQAPAKELTAGKLKKNWQQDLAYTRSLGDGFIQSGQFLVLKVPSVIVPEEYNLLVNPRHPDARKIRISYTRHFKPDQRLIST